VCGLQKPSVYLRTAQVVLRMPEWENVDHRPCGLGWCLHSNSNPKIRKKAACQTWFIWHVRFYCCEAWLGTRTSQSVPTPSRVCDLWSGTGLSLLCGAIHHLKIGSWETWVSRISFADLQQSKTIVSVLPQCCWDPFFLKGFFQ
jgi:hypothetical protein